MSNPVEEWFRLIADTISEVFWITDRARSRVVYISPAFERIWGRSIDELHGDPRGIYNMIHPDDRDRVIAALGREPPETFTHEYRIFRGDGELRWVWGHGYPVGDYIVGVTQDITERRLAEAEKRALAERIELVLRVTHEGIWDWDMCTRTAWWSDAVYALLGYDRTTKPSYEAWAARIHPDDRARVLRGFDAAVAAGRDTWVDDFRIVRNGEVREVHDRAHMQLGPDGKPLRLTGSMVDVTDRRGLEAQLRQAQKMEAVGQLAGGVAHDFNNLLQTMMLELQQLQMQELPERAQTLARSVYGSAKRAASLTRQLLLFSRREVMQRRAVDLDAAITELGRMLHRVLGDDVALELDLRAAPLQVHADRNMLDQVILNLAVNARDAMPRGGTLHIATAPASGGPRPGPFGRITVRDSGMGIPRDVLPRIFEPFFTTKEAGHGTGLGLATAFGIVEQHGGWIEVESEIGVGSTFRVHLPVATVDVAAFAPTPPPTDATRGNETILVVEDNDHVRRVVCEVLSEAGYRVLEAARGDAALQTWSRESGRIDIVLTDVVMPGGMDGRELAARLEALRPGVKIVFATGHGRDFAVRPNQLLLSKPISAQNLLDAVRTCLDA